MLRVIAGDGEMGEEPVIALMRSPTTLPWVHHRQAAQAASERTEQTRRLGGARPAGGGLRPARDDRASLRQSCDFHRIQGKREFAVAKPGPKAYAKFRARAGSSPRHPAQYGPRSLRS